MSISAADVSKLRKMTGAGMMDCKQALEETGGDFESAVEVIRKKGQLVASKRADRDAWEGVVLAGTSDDQKRGALIVLNSETDFVAKNADFVAFAQQILQVALDKMPADLESLKQLALDGRSIGDRVTEQIGIIGEKLDLSFYARLQAEQVTAYVHPGNKLATLAGLSKAVDTQAGRDIAMQVAAMNPVAVDKDDVPADVVEKEKEIGREQARNEGKPENMLERIAEGKLNKFYKESTLLNQDFTKDSSKTVRQYLQTIDKELTATGFVRFTLNQ